MAETKPSAEARPVGGAKPLVVIHSDVATEATKQVLRRAGYAVVVGDPEHFHVVEPIALATMGAITESALEAIKDHACGSVRAEFGRKLCVCLLASGATP